MIVGVSILLTSQSKHNDTLTKHYNLTLNAVSVKYLVSVNQ